MKYAVLTASGALLKKIATHDKSVWGRWVYRIHNFLWEIITPSEVYKIVSSAKYTIDHSLQEHVIQTNRMGYCANVVVAGSIDKQILKKVSLPDLKLSVYDNVCINNESDFIINKKERIVINDYCSNKSDDLGYEDSVTYYQGGKVAILKTIRPSRKLTAGIRIDGRYSFNYYHNVYENLIRLLALEKVNGIVPKDTPIIIDSRIIEVPSFKRIFEILSSGIHREFITINKGECIEVGKLYSISAINFLVPVHLDQTNNSIQDYIFDKEYIQLMRKKLLPYKSSRIFPKRVFITRKNTTHRRINEEEIFALLEPLGFVRQAPEELSFEEQMSLFNNAEWIIGCSGAAFTNLMFCSDNCHIICLDRYGYTRPVFTAPVCFCGAEMSLFYSEPASSESKVHSDFVININEFRRFVNSFIIPSLK